MFTSTAWPNFGRGLGSAKPHALKEASAAFHAIEPRQTMARGCSRRHSSIRYGRQLSSCPRRWLVGGRRAAQCGGNVHAAQLQAVIAADRCGLIRKSGAMQGGVEKIPGAIACEHASGAVAAMCRRSESKDHDLRAMIAERRHGPAPVVPIGKGAASGARNLGAVRPKFRTARAARNGAWPGP